MTLDNESNSEDEKITIGPELAILRLEYLYRCAEERGDLKSAIQAIEVQAKIGGWYGSNSPDRHDSSKNLIPKEELENYIDKFPDMFN